MRRLFNLHLRAGCFDCLVEALKQYEAVRAVSAVSTAAATGALRASALLALRERELGTTDSAYLEHARELAAAVPELHDEVAPLLEVIAAMPWRAGAGRSGQPDSTLTNIYTNREQRTDSLRVNAARDGFSAYMFVAYSCESGTGLRIGNTEMKAAIGSMSSEVQPKKRMHIEGKRGEDFIREVPPLP